MIKERISKLKEKLNFKIIYIVICLGFLVGLLYLNQTHAYYNYEMAPVPIFTSKVGNFAGEGESVKQGPLTDKNSDINVIFYTQMPDNPKKYKVNKNIPITGFKINEEVSNCYPVDNQDGVTYSSYTIKDDGKITFKVKETKPTQVVCRIYYDRDKLSDLIVYAYLKDDSGDKKYNGKNYKAVNKIETTYILDGYSCSDKSAESSITYINGRFKFKTLGPNTCYAYFSK